MKMSRQVAIGAAAVAAGAVLLTRGLRARRRIDFHGRVVVISGGSRGLGLVLARHLAAEGARLLLIARDAAELERARQELLASGAEVATFVADVSKPGQAEDAIAHAIARFGRLDVLVNNAGVIQVGPLEHLTLGDFEEAMGVHFWGPVRTTLAALPHLTVAPGARVVNIASIGGKIAVPHLLPYSASKFALVGLSEGLRAELSHRGIFVTTVAPGLMRTGSQLNAWFKGQHRREYAWFAILGALPLLSIDADKAARRIIEACRYGDASLTITPQAKLAVLARAVAPGLTARLLGLTNLLLPGASRDAEGAQARSGWQSPSRLAPSWLTRLSDRATARNNELPHSA